MAEDETPERWSDEQTKIFSRIMRHMSANQRLFAHPHAQPIPQDHWETTCWNAAYFAADSIGDARPWVHLDEDGNEIGAEIPPGRMC